MNWVRKLLIVIIILAVGTFLTWAPWLNNTAIEQAVYAKWADRDGTTQAGCDYRAMYFPFGRWVVSCEGAAYVTFWGKVF